MEAAAAQLDVLRTDASPMTTKRSRVPVAGRILLIPLVAVAVYWGLLFFFQRRLLYPAPRGATVLTPPSDAQALRLADARGRPVFGWYLAPDTATPAAIVIFLHGNAERTEEWLSAWRTLRAAGVGIALVEYPGYGIAPGDPSEESLTEAAVAVYDSLRKARSPAEVPFVVYGRSLGGGVATRLATRRPVAGVILESTFTDLREFASQVLAPGFLVRDRFDNRGELARFNGPLLVLHGEHDEIAPIAGGRALASVVAGAQFVALPCGHNDCERPWPVILKFLRDRGLARPAG
jgi:uncharacterized protein